MTAWCPGHDLIFRELVSPWRSRVHRDWPMVTIQGLNGHAAAPVTLDLAQLPDAVGDLEGCLIGLGRVAAEAVGASMLK
jgi:hypothetical protein